MDVVTLGQARVQGDKRYARSYALPALRKLARGSENVNIAVLTDSTGQTQISGNTPRWPRLVCNAIAALFPAYTVIYHEWSSDGSQDQYDGTIYPAVTIQTGTGTANAGGPFVLNFYNGSISGSITASFLGQGPSGIVRYPGIIGNLDCELVFVAFGHNHALTDRNMSMPSLVEQVALDNPRANIILVAQSPSLNDLRNSVHASYVEEYAATRGFGFVDFHQVVIDAGSPTSWYVNSPFDGVHPSLLGSQKWADTVMTYIKGTQFPQQQPSTLSTVVESLLKNSDLTDIGNTLKDWTMFGNAVATADATKYDRPQIGQSVKVTAPTANTAAGISQTVTIPPSWRGKWVTFAARLFKSASSSANAGIITIDDGVSASASGGAFGSQAYNGWYWAFCSMKIGPTAGALNVRVYSEYTSTNAATTGFVNIDRTVLIPGRHLRDVPVRRQGSFTTDVTIRSQRKLRHSETSNDCMGLVTLAAGTAAVTTTAFSSSDRIFWAVQDSGGGSGTWGEIGLSVSGSTLTWTSTSNTDTRKIAWFLIGQAG